MLIGLHDMVKDILWKMSYLKSKTAFVPVLKDYPTMKSIHIQ